MYLSRAKDCGESDFEVRFHVVLQKPEENIDYGIFSSSIDKNFAKKFIEQELLKTKLSKDPSSMTIDDLEPFGKSFFVKYPSSFMPVTEPALSSEYILNIGDSVSIEITGSLELDSVMEITRQGTILIPKVGVISVAGMSLTDARIAINKSVQKLYIGADSFVSISFQELLTSSPLNVIVYSESAAS